MSERQNLDLDRIRATLQSKQGTEYWRCLEELAETEEFREFLHREFPREASVWDESVGRRQFLMLMGASLALAGLNACTKQPDEKIIPYVRSPEQVTPGKPLAFATAMVQSGYATGILVTSHMGRPTKIEGNPDHPASLGSTDAFTQASILSLYDPDRSQVPLNRGTISTRDRFLAALSEALRARQSAAGAGLRILTESITSPTLGDQFARLLRQFPRAQWHQYEPVDFDNVRKGARHAFGRLMNTRYHFDRADIVVSLDSDFLTHGPAAVRYASDFAQKRKVAGGKRSMNRLYALESSPTNVGAVADHRLAVTPLDVELCTRAIARELGIQVRTADVGKHRTWLSALVSDLQRHRGASVVVPGVYQSPAVHALAHAINERLGNTGKTVSYSDPVEVQPAESQMASLRELVDDIRRGEVKLLVILGANPAYSSPADLDFGSALESVPFSVHLGLYSDETAALSTWHLPQAHYLETWSDARSYDGTATILQPLITPLYGGVSSPHELLELMLGKSDPKSYDIIRDYWRKQVKAAEFETFWQTSLNDGIVAGSAFPQRDVRVRFLDIAALPAAQEQQADTLDLVLRPDPTVWDGRFANNGWLQELPKPMTTITWDNAILVSPSTAGRFALQNEDVVEISHSGRSITGPVWITPGHPDRSMTVHFGYGRTRAGRVGSNRGFNAYMIRSSASPWSLSGIRIRKTGQRYRLAITQHHHSMEGRNLVRSATLAEFLANPRFATEHENPRNPSLYPPHEYDGYAWGMSIDLNACTGCNACVIACQSENNIPIVGKDQVIAGREMHWIRIDRYYKGSLDDPEIVFQPVTCMHCENAPCEVVCPVAATVHDSEGLNVMVYNRCIGTRYCSNNCPYKVRRFNFLQYSSDNPTVAMQKNPEVTVRSRGVMEKCSYCVQRISAARIEAKKESRQIRDGEVVTACQA
ncbi:MAG: TAT-variant-translocated molybdopterin oxidoreductase, partial [Ignavibacteriales bacterium]|nr:TAT-variant-translocated molybdopterin oxidoreductase [Ignavibacteriales bacterium]